jgi:hypothetical protein
MSKAIVELGTSKSVVEQSKSKVIVEPSTSKAVKTPKLEVIDENPTPIRKRITKVRLEKEAQEKAEEEARQKAELAKTHEMRCKEKEALRTGIRRNPIIFHLRK